MDEPSVAIRFRIGSEADGPLNATAIVEMSGPDDALSLVLESAGGSGKDARNPDYALALRLALQRMGASPAGIQMTGAEVDSQPLTGLSPEERQLSLRDHSFPVNLWEAADFEALRRDLTSAQRHVGQSAGVSGGNERRRLRLHLGFIEEELRPQDLVFVLDNGAATQGPSNQATASAFILTWNPDKWDWTDRQSEIKESSSGAIIDGQWATGNRTQGIQPGDRAYLHQQGAIRGIVASGYFVSEPFQGEHWDGTAGKTGNFACVVWDRIVSDDDRLDIEELRAVTTNVPWDNIQASGLALTPEDAQAIDRLWSGVEVVFTSPEEESGHTLTEGGRSRVEVNRYERNPKARRKCLDHYGSSCSVCEMDFEAEYGEIGTGFIHVHHLLELSSIGTEYEVDPIADLRPVCPNCHAMLHTRRPAYSIEELRKIRHDIEVEEP